MCFVPSDVNRCSPSSFFLNFLQALEMPQWYYLHGLFCKSGVLVLSQMYFFSDKVLALITVWWCSFTILFVVFYFFGFIFIKFSFHSFLYLFLVCQLSVYKQPLSCFKLYKLWPHFCQKEARGQRQQKGQGHRQIWEGRFVILSFCFCLGIVILQQIFFLLH